MSRSRSYHRLGVLIKTLEDDERLLEVKLLEEPSNARALLFELAKIRLVIHKDKFFPTIERIFSIEDDYTPAKYLVGRWFQNHGEIGKALEQYQGVVEKSGSRGTFYEKSVIRVGQCNFMLGFFMFAQNYWSEFRLFSSPKCQFRSIKNLIFYHLFYDENFELVEHFLEDGFGIDKENVLLKIVRNYLRIVKNPNVKLPLVTKCLQNIQRMVESIPRGELSPVINFIKAKLYMMGITVKNMNLALKELEEGLQKRDIFLVSDCLRCLRLNILAKMRLYSVVQKDYPLISTLREENVVQYHQMTRTFLRTLFSEFRMTLDYEKLKDVFRLCSEVLKDEESFRDKISVISPTVLSEISNIYRFKSNKLLIGYELIRRADLILPNTPSIQILYGWYLYFYSSQFNEAVSILQKTRERKPNDCQLHRNLGDIYYSEENYEDSVSHLKVALEFEDERMMDIDRFNIMIKLAKCYEFLGKREKKYRIVDQLLEEISSRNVPESQNLVMCQIYLLDRSYSTAYEYLKKIKIFDILNEEEKDEYYNISATLVSKSKNNEILMNFYDVYFSPSFESFHTKKIREKFSVSSKCLIASSMNSIGETKKGDEIFEGIRTSIENEIQRLEEQPKEERDDDDEEERNEKRLENLRWDLMTYYVTRSRSYFECKKLKSSLEVLMVGSLFLRNKLLVPKKKKTKKSTQEKQEEEEDDKNDNKIVIPFHRRLIIIRMMFQKGMIFEKLGVIDKAITEYTNILLSFHRDKEQEQLIKKVDDEEEEEESKEEEEGEGEEKNKKKTKTEQPKFSSSLPSIIGMERHDYYISALDHRMHCYRQKNDVQKAIEDLKLLYHPEDSRTYLHTGLLSLIFETLSNWGLFFHFQGVCMGHLSDPSVRAKMVQEERRSCFEDLYNVRYANAEFLEEKFIMSLFSRGRILFKLRKYDKTIEDMTKVLEYFSKYEKFVDEIKECYHCLGYSLINLNRGEEATNTFRKMIERFPDDDRAFLARSRAHFVGGVNLRNSLDDLLTACRVNTTENREEKKGLLRSYLSAVKRIFNVQIESEFSLSKQMFKMYRDHAVGKNDSFKFLFADDVIYVHPMFAYVSPYLRREFLSKGINEIRTNVSRKKSENGELLWKVYSIIRDWMMCIGIPIDVFSELLSDTKLLEEVYFLARKMELRGLMCYLVREVNPFIMQDRFSRLEQLRQLKKRREGQIEGNKIEKEEIEPRKFKTEILKMSIRLISRGETESMLFLNCLGFFRYLVDMDDRRHRLEEFRRKSTPTKKRTKRMLSSENDEKKDGKVVRASSSMTKMTSNKERETSGDKSDDDDNPNSVLKIRESDFLFEKGDLDDEQNQLREELVAMIREKIEPDMQKSSLHQITPVDYLRKLLDRHPNFQKRKSDCQPSTIYEKLLIYLWENDRKFRNLWIIDQDKKTMRVHAEVLLTKMSFCRELFKTEEILKLSEEEEEMRHKEMMMEDVPTRILMLMMGFHYKERETVRNFDIANWRRKEDFDQLLNLVRKYKMKRLEIVLVLKYLKDVQKDW